MINIKLKKDAIKKGSSDETIMLDLVDSSETSKEKKQKKQLNIGIAIDVSGSMMAPINEKATHRVNGIAFPESLDANAISRLDKAKMVVLKTIDNMNDGDIVSITAFSHKVINVIDSIKLSKENRFNIREKVNALQPMGMTDLYSGWLASVEQVAKKLDAKNMNRILLISDGEITQGVKGNEKIAKDVRKIASKGISTSTFGVGESFNEDLLQAISDASSANSYYVEDDESMNKVFEDEFSDLKNISGTEVSISFELKKGVSIKDNMCDFNVENDSYLLPNIRRIKSVYALFRLKMDENVTSGKNANLGNIVLKYKDNNGQEVVLKEKIEAKVVSEKEYRSLPENEDVMVQDVLMEVAKTKKQATEAIDKQDIDSAKKLLDGSMSYLRGMNDKYKDNRLKASLKSTEDTLLNAKNNDIGVLRKEITSQTYMTTRSMV